MNSSSKLGKYTWPWASWVWAAWVYYTEHSSAINTAVLHHPRLAESKHVQPAFLFCSVAKLCLTLCNAMGCSRLLCPSYLSEFVQIRVHRDGDAIQPSHPLLRPSPSAFNLAQHQGLFQRVGSSHQVAKILELQLQHQSFQW